MVFQTVAFKITMQYGGVVQQQDVMQCYEKEEEETLDKWYWWYWPLRKYVTTGKHQNQSSSHVLELHLLFTSIIT